MSRIAMLELKIHNLGLRKVRRGNNYERAQISYKSPGQPLQIVSKNLSYRIVLPWPTTITNRLEKLNYRIVLPWLTTTTNRLENLNYRIVLPWLTFLEPRTNGCSEANALRSGQTPIRNKNLLAITKRIETPSGKNP